MKRLIVVDDDEGIQDIFSLIFSRAGYKVEVYSAGTPLMEDHLEKPDIFILDKQLSGIDGLDICRFLKHKKETQDVPIIMISANPNIKYLSKEAGADDFLEKPFKMKELLEMVEKYV